MGLKDLKTGEFGILCAQEFAKAGFVFIKFNFSHNGTGLENTSEFIDLQAFGENNYSKELIDIGSMLNWITTQQIIPENEIAHESICFVGHSRGGGIGIIAAHLFDAITSIITWASVDDLAFMWRNNPAMVKNWKMTGVHYLLNGRTKQEMPLYFQLHTDWINNEQKFDVQSTLEKLEKPLLILHGDKDPAVPMQAALNIHQWARNSKLVIIKGGDHVFRGSHPFPSEQLPPEAQVLIAESIRFLN